MRKLFLPLIGLTFALSACGDEPGVTDVPDGGPSAADAGSDVGIGPVNDAGRDAPVLPPPPANCTAPSTPNVWEAASSGLPTETFAFAVDPRKPEVIYVGTFGGKGVWKSTDCGASWKGPVNTGFKFSGMIWAMTVDPVTSDLYATDGYGGMGVLKSTDGGVHWTQLLPKAILDVTSNGFVNHISIDPTDHLHLVADFHTFVCTGTAPPGAPIVQNNDYNNPKILSYTQSTPTGSGTNSGWGCLAETHDGGGNWVLKAAPVPWGGADGPGITVIDDTTWYFGQQGGKLWRTTSAGVPVNGQPAWTQANVWVSCQSGACAQPMSGSTGFVYRATDGTFYTAGSSALVHSTDGQNWTQISNAYAPAIYDLNGLPNIVDTGTTVYASNNSTNEYYSGSLSAIGAYTAKVPTQLVKKTAGPGGPKSGGIQLAYDPINHFLYASGEGIWRMRTP